MKSQTKSYIYALSAILCWSTVGTAFKLALQQLDYSNLLFGSILISFFIFILLTSILKKWQLVFKQTKQDILKSALLGFINPALYYYILFLVYDILPAQEALSLNYFWPIVLVILSVPILKHKLNFIGIISIFISFVGCLIITTRGDFLSFRFSNPIGILLALSTTLVWSFFWLLNVKDHRDEVIKLLMNFGFGLFYVTLYMLFTNKIKVPNINGSLLVIYIGIFEMGITFYLWLKALSYTQTTIKISNLIYISPFISLLFINFILNEKILFSTILGLIFIVIGILLQGITQHKGNKQLKK